MFLFLKETFFQYCFLEERNLLQPYKPALPAVGRPPLLNLSPGVEQSPNQETISSPRQSYSPPPPCLEKGTRKIQNPSGFELPQFIWDYPH